MALLAAPLHAAPSFRSDVLPILEQRCHACHRGASAQAGLSLTSAAAMTKGGSSGPAIAPGEPDVSLILQRIAGDKPSMPPVGEPLAAEEVQIIRDWIAAGALDDGGSVEETWWSLRRLERPSVPVAAERARTPIDRFIAAKLSEKGLKPSPEASRRTLIRRLCYDLHGLPPSPEEVDAFVTDPSPHAYERLVDRLLDSPRYGERWGRHWLDVAHYGESHGYDKDKPRRNAWPYRDYVIRAFNDDKPYARFVREQIAGDVLFPETPEGLIATGFLAAGPWDYVGHAELREGTRDKRIARLLDRDDMLMTAMSTFSSLTVHCARCHDHKFDPILQSDYYALQAVFAGVDRADRPYDDDREVFSERKAILEDLRRIALGVRPIEARIAAQTNGEIQTLLSEAEEIGKRRTLLNHEKTAGETLEQQARNAELDAEMTRLAEQIRGLNTRVREIRLSLLDSEERERLEQLHAEEQAARAALEALPEPKRVYAAAPYFESYGKFTPSLEPRPVSILGRGDVDSPVAPARPGAVTAVETLPGRFDAENEGERRAALADWLVHPDNPLTWRSIVNRVWHYHFGKGLVDSPNDFGRMGSRPTHPELLDWLAVEFRDSGGSMKHLHRLILNSAVYRQSSAGNEEYARIDRDNQFLWRMNARRLDAESVRDAALQIGGSLDLTMGGPSEEHFWFKNDHSPIYDYARFDPAAKSSQRRSVYRFLVRSVPDPLMESLDCPDPSLLTPKRNVTMTAVQALALLNDPLLIEQSRRLAERLRMHSSDFSKQVGLLYRLALSRAPEPQETGLLANYSEEHGLENLCRLVLNSNEFLFVD